MVVSYLRCTCERRGKTKPDEAPVATIVLGGLVILRVLVVEHGVRNLSKRGDSLVSLRIQVPLRCRMYVIEGVNVPAMQRGCHIKGLHLGSPSHLKVATQCCEGVTGIIALEALSTGSLPVYMIV